MTIEIIRMSGMKEHQRELAELICLVYHEARNVRHPIKARKLVNGAKYARLVSLPNNRLEAWRSMARIRERAAAAKTGRKSAGIFEREFGVNLADLDELYRAPCWKNSSYGGNKWAPICSMVKELIEALDRGDKAKTAELLKKIPTMQHNTGVVEAKLKALQSE